MDAVRNRVRAGLAPPTKQEKEQLEAEKKAQPRAAGKEAA